MISFWLILLLMSVATFRLTRLATTDTFPPLVGLIERLETKIDKPWFQELLSCSWCSSVWIGFFVTWGTWLILWSEPKPHWVFWMLAWQVCSAVTGLLTGVSDSEESD